ncbi:MAG: AmmeMemoRadiSam system radical SAM enzyme [Desulfobacterales bacterium]|nr:AmmeMemoRadiSam system radical SAM enzyme [Desulfobacterales bacterium]
MEAFLYDKLEDKKVKCKLCNHRCVISNGKRGICSVRENENGILRTLVYGRVIARNIDPIEKKPLFHFYPGSRSYSIATVGCNLRCRFCQNSDISQMPTDHKGKIAGDSFMPENIVNSAINANCKSISYTYTEPTIYFEFAFDTAKIAHEKNIQNVFVTNGYMTPETLHMISPYLDAANVDLKGYSEDFYKKFCGASLEPVKDNLKLMKSLGIFVEITTLLIPGLNDNEIELEKLALFIAESLGVDTPWHISRFHPTYKLTDRGVTPLKSLMAAYEIGVRSGLKYVYTGNAAGEKTENTFCPKCAKLLIERWGVYLRDNRLKKAACPDCSTIIEGRGL